MSSSWKNPDITKLPEPSSVMIACGQYKTVTGKAKEVARILEATQGRYCRSQPGCLHYIHGVAADKEEDMAMPMAIFTSKEACFSLPKIDGDLEKLNEARKPALELIQGGSFDTGASYFLSDKSYYYRKDDVPAPPPPDVKFPTFDEIFTKEHPVNVDKVEDREIFMALVKFKIKDGSKVEEFVKGFQATNGDFYCNSIGLPQCIYYGIGIGDVEVNGEENTAVAACIFDSKATFDSLPESSEDSELLTKNREPYYSMMDIDKYFASSETYSAK